MATPLLISEFLDRFGKHAATSEAMAGKTNMDVIPEYGFQTGYDFQRNFPGLNPKISSGLAAAYQTLQEGTRALLDGPGGVTLKDAFDTAKKQAAENIEGILAADSGNITAKQLANRNAYLANQGFLDNEKGIVNTADNRISDFLSNLFFTPAGAGSDRVNLPNIDITNQLDDYYEKGEMMDNVADAPEAGITTKLLDAIKGAGSAISNLGIVGLLKNVDQFKNLSPLDQQFILQQAGGNRPAKDRFGYNIRSAFGNYADLVGDRVDIARDRIARGIPLRAIDQYYLNKEKERRALEEKAQREFLANQARTQSRGGDGPQNNPQGGLGRQDYSRAASADFASLADELGIDYR